MQQHSYTPKNDRKCKHFYKRLQNASRLYILFIWSSKLPFMHYKFTSDNQLETIAKKSTNLYLTLGEWKTYTWTFNQLKANNWSAENLKKHVNLMSYGHVTLVSR